MLDSNTILGVSGYLNCKEYEHGILIQNWENFPLGAPVVYQSNSLEKNKQGATRVLTLMTSAQASAGLESANTHTELIVPVNLKPLCKNHKVVTTSQFDVGKLDRLTEFVHDVGGISFVIEYEEGRKNIGRSLEDLEKIFKYTTMFQYNAWSNKYLNDDDDHYICVLTFLDLPYCVPLFNTHKVDGIGLSLSGALQKTSADEGLLDRVFRTDLIYSNYMDNVLVIDGVNINTNEFPRADIYKELGKMAGQKLKVAPPGKSKEKRNMYGEYAKFGEDATLEVSPSEAKHSLAPSAAPQKLIIDFDQPLETEQDTREDAAENKSLPELPSVGDISGGIGDGIKFQDSTAYFTTTANGIISNDSSDSSNPLYEDEIDEDETS